MQTVRQRQRLRRHRRRGSNGLSDFGFWILDWGRGGAFFGFFQSKIQSGARIQNSHLSQFWRGGELLAIAPRHRYNPTRPLVRAMKSMPQHISFWRGCGRTVLGLLLVIIFSGCDRSKPEAIWCETGTGPAQVVYPRGIAYKPQDDTFFVVDRMARVQHLNQKGDCIGEWRMPKWALGKPVGISVGPDGNVYVPDTHYQRVMVYSPEGTLLRQWGSEGTGPGQFIFPTDIAFDSKGNIFVSEYGDNDRIQVFSPDAKLLYQIGKFGTGPGEFMRPQSMVIDGDVLYVTDACNHRIQVFKTDGTFVRIMGGVGSGPGQFRYPYGLDQDNHGHLIVCEFGNNRCQMIDKQTGHAVKMWGSAGHEPGQLAYPWAIAVDKKDHVVAVDAGNNRLQVFEF